MVWDKREAAFIRERDERWGISIVRWRILKCLADNNGKLREKFDRRDWRLYLVVGMLFESEDILLWDIGPETLDAVITDKGRETLAELPQPYHWVTETKRKKVEA